MSSNNGKTSVSKHLKLALVLLEYETQDVLKRGAEIRFLIRCISELGEGGEFTDAHYEEYQEILNHDYKI